MSASRRCVLAVANDPAERAALTQALRAAGYSVVSAVTFTGALELLSTTPPDVLISDVRLREFNGLHLALYARDYLVRGTIVMGTQADVPLAVYLPYLGSAWKIVAMTTKEKAISVINSLDDDVTLDHVIDRLYLLRKIEIGIAQVDDGDVMEHDEFMAELEREDVH